jgi:hypothetical protein
MKIALCTTTIHIPHALKLMRKCSDTVRFFVAADENTPDEAEVFICELPNSQFNLEGGGEDDSYEKQWKCSEAIGWNTLARRNIAFLEALAWNADVIYSWDDDNLVIDVDHFDLLRAALRYEFDGIKVDGAWFDPGSLLVPPVRHRGYPYDNPRMRHVGHVIDAKVGVAAGLVLGDPDIDAVTRMEHHPDIGQVHQLAQTGVVVDINTWTVFNTQNTAVVRELVPAWFLMPNVGRHDDIYASLIVQRVARERNYHVHFGPPFTYQQRNEHNLIKDLRAEIDGMENVARLADLLDSIVLPARSVIEDVRIIYEQLRFCEFIPQESAAAGLVWLEDCEAVL